MSYIDGFLAPVAPSSREAYIDHARAMAPLFKEHGALAVVETLASDVPHGKVTDFYRAVAATGDETVAFSWILWPSKEVRDAAWAKIMADGRMKPGDPMPFDGKRMVFGGFEVVVEA